MRNNVSAADNQQGSPLCNLANDPSETTRRSPFVDTSVCKAYLQGALHDGSQNRGNRIRFTQKYPVWLQRLKKLLSHLGHKLWMYKEGADRNVFCLETTASFLDFVFNPLSSESQEAKLAYVSGFFDAEGGIPRSGDVRFYVQLALKDCQKLERIKQILERSDISCGKIHNPSSRVDPEYWRFYVSTKSHVDFARKITSLHPIKKPILRERMKI